LKIFLNLISVNAGGQLIRATKFLEKIEKDSNDIQIVVVKKALVLPKIKTTKNRTVINFSGKFNLLKRFWWENLQMHKLIEYHSCDVFLTFSHYLPIKKISIPTVVGVSNLAPFSKVALSEEKFYYKLKFWVLGKTIIYSARKADCILALSLTAKDTLIDLDLKSSKIIYNPIGVDNFWKIDIKNNAKPKVYNFKKKYFLYVSHFYRYKNHFRLIKAYSLLPSYVKNKYNLILIGSPSNKPYFEETKNLILNLNLEQNIILIPGLCREDLRVFYQNSSLFIFPSLVENCPNILLEAMASGNPICTVDVDPMKEYCMNAAIYFDGNNIDSIKNSIIKYLSTKDNFKEFKNRSLQRSEDFSWDYFSENLIQIITNLNKIK
jgi:glycosyltransferase involved in cell wall biosynthesis